MNRATAALAILFIVGLFNNIDRALISILQVPIKQDLDLSDSQLGMLTGFSFSLVYALVLLPMGRMVDRYRRTWLLAAALTLWTLLTAASGFARGFATLLLCRLGVAFGEAAGNPASYSLLADYFPAEKRGRAFAVFAVAPFLGVFVGIFAGGFLAADLGWRNSFFIVGLFGLLVVPLLLWLPEPKRGQQEADQTSFADEPPPIGKAMALLFAMPAFRWLVFAMTCHSFVTAAYLNWTAPFLSRVHGLPLAEVGLWAALPIGIGGAIGSLAGGFTVDIMTRRSPGWYGWGTAIATLLLFFAGAAQYLTPSVSVSIGFSFLTGALTSFFLAPSYASAQTLVPPAMRGMTTAVLTLIPVIFGSGLGPLVAGMLSDYFTLTRGLGDEGLRYAMLIAFLPAFGGALGSFMMGQHFARRATIPAA